MSRRWRKPPPKPDYLKPEFIAEVRKYIRQNNRKKATEHFNLSEYKMTRILNEETY